MTAKSQRWPGLVVGLCILGLIQHTYGQESLAIPLDVSPSDCSPNEFYDTSLLQCSSCPAGSFPASSQLACVRCDAGSGSFFNFDFGLAINQNWIPSTQSASARSCACSSVPSGNTAVVAPAISNGTFYQRCVVCPSGTGPPTSGQQVCAPGNNVSRLSPSPLDQLITALSLLGLSNLSPATATQATISVPTAGGGIGTLLIQRSQPLWDMLGPVTMNCLGGLGTDRAACNAVANLCALTLYNPDAGPCLIYEALVSRFLSLGGYPSPPPSPPRSSGGSRRTSFRPATGPMPWLFYAGTGYLDDPNMDLRVQFSGGSLAEGQVSVLTFVLSATLLNGTWLGYNTWTSQFQLCGAPVNDGSRWPRYGWNYRNQCSIKLEMLLGEAAEAFTNAGDTVMYELFLQVSPSTLYPVPVYITNVEGASADEGAVRRFFYVDSRLGFSAQSDRQQAVQYPSVMWLGVVNRMTPRDQIYVPQLQISYLGWETDTLSNIDLDPDVANVQQDVVFSVTYSNDQALTERFWYAWRTILIVFEVALAFPVAMLAVFRFMRKKRETADMDFLVYAVVCLADYGAFALAMVLLVVSLYYLILYKLQEEVYYMMLQDWQLQNYRITVILAVVGQSLGLVWALYRQIRTDVFFIDWEKPRKVISKEGGREEPSPVSCWRLLMVANEFNELQTVRVTYPAFTFLMLVMILEGANVIAAGDMNPDANDYHEYFGNTTSIILRMGIEAFFFLVLFLGQYLFKWLIYYPYVENPMTQFIDLMYLANVSTVIFDDTHSGYYLHGRNQAQHSDTTLRDLNQELLKEEDGLTSQRGLVNSSSNPTLADNQMFLMYVLNKVRTDYDGKMLQLAQQATNESRNRKGTVSTFMRGSGRQSEGALKGYADVTNLFKKMLEDVERNQAQQVIDPTYLQRVLQMPPENSANANTFVHDYFYSWTNVLFIGAEIRLYVYEAVFFCAIDMSLQNVALSALLTFVMIRVVAYVRAKFGEDNLSQKTLVDRHFLI